MKIQEFRSYQVIVVIMISLLLVGLATQAFCAPKSGVTLDKFGRFYVDGKQEFPLAIYVAFETQWLDMDKRQYVLSSLDDLKNSPFRVVVNYGDSAGTPAQAKKLLDEMHKRGLYDLFSIKDYFPSPELEAFKTHVLPDGKPKVYPTAEEEVLRTYVKTLKDHPAVIGWYVWDEFPKSADRVSQHDQWVKAEGSNKPTFIVSCDSKAAAIEPFTTAADIIALDPYPLPKRPVTMVADWMDELSKANKTKRPQWMVPQAFGWYMYDEEIRKNVVKPTPKRLLDKGRMPTPREMRAMTYLGLTHSAEGFVYYYYNDIMMNDDGGVSWNAVKSIAQEVKDLSPILLASDAKKNSISGDNPAVHWIAKQKDGKTYIIAVNSSTQTQNAVFTLPSAIKKVNLVKGTGVTYPYNNELLVTFDGYEAVVVEL